MSQVSFRELQPAKGEQARGIIRVPGVEPTWEVPAVVIRGEQDGPTLVVTGGIHAAEYVSIEAVTQLSRWVDPKRLRGTLIAVLIVNTPGFFAHSIYVNPIDNKNIRFPGDPNGTASEKVAHFLATELIDGADAYIDAHCGDMIEALVPFTLWAKVDDPDVSARAHAMAQVYGLERTLCAANAVGSTYFEMAKRGVPGIVGEVGQQGICDKDLVKIHLRGMQNVMAHLGMIDPLGPPPAPPRELAGMAWTRSSVAGTYHPAVAVGDLVKKGQVTGELHDLFGETIEVHQALADGEVIFLVTALAVAEGGPLLGIATYDAADNKSPDHD
ncbi:MAG: succinylglutamate desuccinylase/aspartoacylase family protein [Micrococcales bacterium]|nr:succinylglutamate desuccinylase/aspartoacylase family protein [Micrococcales bacterium]